jgi:hypothetical protein
MVEWNWQISIYIFLIFKILKWIFDYLKNKLSTPGLFKAFIIRCYKYFYKNSIFSILLVACFESNMIYLCFYGTLQLKNGFAFQKIDSINILISVLMIFLAFVYAILFNLRLYKCNKKKTNIRGEIKPNKFK